MSLDNVTFIAWSDTHFGFEQQFAQSDFRWGIIDQMNGLPGWPYPDDIGGVVDTPDFAVHLGDFVDGEKQADYELGLYDYFRQQLIYPQHEVLGNHDLVFDEVVEQFIGRHGARSYSFDVGRYHFVSLCTDYDTHPNGSVEDSEMVFLEDDLSQITDQYVVLFVHSRLDRVHQGDAVLNLLGKHRTILMMSGHLHKPAIYDLAGMTGVDIGHCRSHPIDVEYGRSFCVVRLTSSNLTAIPWRWDLKDWEQAQRWSNPAETKKRFILTKSL